jgi:phospholipid transport system substrate-binding protein
MKTIKVLVVAFGVFFAVSIFAADPAPLVMLKSTSGRMLKELNKNIGKLKNNDKLVYDLVNRVLVPHFDLPKMSGSVVGVYWSKASKKTQQQFIKEFTSRVIRTYSTALQSYDGETIKFFPIRGVIGKRVQVDSDLQLKNGPPIQMQYRLLKKGSKWLIYDFSVDGISIVKNYHSQFASALRQGGLAGLVKQLQRKK